MKRQNCKIVLFILITSPHCLASDCLKSLTSNPYTTALASGISTIGAPGVTTLETLAPYAQEATQQLSTTWSTLPRETQQLILGGGALATAAYNTPKLWRYLMNRIESRKNSILDQAKGVVAISDTPLEELKKLFPGVSNDYVAVLNLFKFNSNANFPTERGELLFFKYLKALLEDKVYELKQEITSNLKSNTITRNTFMQRWIIKRSGGAYEKLYTLISFNKELAEIIAQLEKEIEAHFNIYL